ncbi:polysaccharide deacetylase family protein [Rhodococcus spelaei]|uniref:Polysaccharide deacetylase family protein n=1 Tax=Rhodococcus spelaei TaxID=2546320 RepID=A0A541BSD1_9NOCA|nr:polysaccharide deacetylase family protein [Rhodococcus spelaei]TQF75226.1 polysaccharide deacetylase family protein [Rhodococcus spelaei]
MHRRQFMTMLAAGACAALSGCSTADGAPAVGEVTPAPPPPPPAPTTPPLLPPPALKTPLSPGTITALPGPGSSMALTVDDGASPEVVAAYVKFAKDTGARFTFFVTASYDSWTESRKELRPLVDSGQIQLANHTWDHPDLTKLSGSGVASQLQRTRDFLKNQYGVDGTPFYRPPYGFHNGTVDRVAADLGYTVPTLWYGSLSDSGVITEDYLLQCARKYFNPQTIVIGHANHPAVTHVYPQLVDIIKERKLSMVTLDDVLARPRQ